MEHRAVVDLMGKFLQPIQFNAIFCLPDEVQALPQAWMQALPQA